jgi:hypothetical protein
MSNPNTIQSLVKLAELLESKGMSEYAKQVEEIIKAVADDKMDEAEEEKE